MCVRCWLNFHFGLHVSAYDAEHAQACIHIDVALCLHLVRTPVFVEPVLVCPKSYTLLLAVTLPCRLPLRVSPTHTHHTSPLLRSTVCNGMRVHPQLMVLTL